MQVQRKQNGVSIYCLSNGSVLPEGLGDRAKRKLNREDGSVRRRVEVLQDFEFPAASSRIVQAGEYIIAAGIYPPRIRCYDTKELSMKFERYVTSEIVDLVALGDDYGKLAILQDDRNVAVHAHYGAHTSVRIPVAGRCLRYDTASSQLLATASSQNSIFRLDLEEGRFLEPWTYESNQSIRGAASMDNHRYHPVTAVGCEDGTVRWWDQRHDKLCLQLDVGQAVHGKSYGDDLLKGLTSLKFDTTSGWYMAAGTANGVVALYDIRSSRPLHTQAHKSGTSIHSVLFHGTKHIASADEQIIKIWKQKNGEVVVNMEGNAKLTDVCIADDTSGLLLCATDKPKMDVFYVPALGIAPKWCSFLENITEELEESTADDDVFENYKFVTTKDLETLGVTHLIGTPLLKAYMHGYFMDSNLHRRLHSMAASTTDTLEAIQKRQLDQRMAAKSRVAAAPTPSRAVTDSRFGALTTNPDFEIDETTTDFKLRHPSGVSKKKQKEEDELMESEDEVLEQRAEGSDNDHEDEDEEDSFGDNDEDSLGAVPVRGEAYDEMMELNRTKPPKAKKARESSDKKKRPKTAELSNTVQKPRKRQNMVLEEIEGEFSAGRAQVASRTDVPLAKQLESLELNQFQVKVSQGGEKEVSFVPKGKSQREEKPDDEDKKNIGQRERRGIKELGFKSPFRNQKRR